MCDIGNQYVKLDWPWLTCCGMRRGFEERYWFRTHRWQIAQGVAAPATLLTGAIISSVEVCCRMAPLSTKSWESWHLGDLLRIDLCFPQSVPPCFFAFHIVLYFIKRNLTQINHKLCCISIRNPFFSESFGIWRQSVSSATLSVLSCPSCSSPLHLFGLLAFSLSCIDPSWERPLGSGARTVQSGRGRAEMVQIVSFMTAKVQQC